VALIKNCPHPEAGRNLVDFLVSAEVERMLAESDSGNIPVRAALRQELTMELPPSSSLPYDRIADQMQPSFAAVREILIH
jgi:iron(III) transport system substrate-binding protein